MKVKDFINLFKKLGYDDDTELLIGTFDLNGDWYNFEFEVDDDDRQLDSSYNNLAIVLEPSEDYIDSRFEGRFDIDDVSRRIYEDVRWILTHDEN